MHVIRICFQKFLPNGPSCTLWSLTHPTEIHTHRLLYSAVTLQRKRKKKPIWTLKLENIISELRYLIRALQERKHFKNVLQRGSAANQLSSYFQSLAHPLIDFFPVLFCFHIFLLEPANMFICLRI